METDIDIQSDMGRFGWEELIGGLVIPYIVRGNRKFCSLEIFTKHVARNFYNNLNDVDLQKFDGLQIHHLTEIESYLMNEINHFHCDSLYDHNFEIDDPLLEIGDIGGMAQFFHDCHQKLNRGGDYDLKNGGILKIRIKNNGRRNEFRVPYVRLNCILYVPINKCEFYKGTPKQSVELTGINLQYMKFMHKVLRMRVDNIGPCMPFEEIHDAFSSTDQIKVTEYWPKNDLLNRFYMSAEPTILTFSVNDENPAVSEYETPWSCEMSRIDLQRPSTFVSTNQQQIATTTSEPSAELNQLVAVREEESPWSCEMPTTGQQFASVVASPNQQQNTTTIKEALAELPVKHKKKKREIDENGNVQADSMGRRTRKRVKFSLKRNDKNAPVSASTSRIIAH